MKKYYIYKAEGPDVQSGIDLRYQVDGDDNISQKDMDNYLDEIGYNMCAENFEMYCDIEKWEEEEGIEWEANFYFKEVTKKEFDECELCDLD